MGDEGHLPREAVEKPRQTRERGEGAHHGASPFRQIAPTAAPSWTSSIRRSSPSRTRSAASRRTPIRSTVRWSRNRRRTAAIAAEPALAGPGVLPT